MRTLDKPINVNSRFLRISNMETTTIEKSLNSVICEFAAIFLYNTEILYADPSSQNCFTPPDKIEQRKTITDIAKKFSDRKTTIPKTRSVVTATTRKPKSKQSVDTPAPQVHVTYTETVLNGSDVNPKDLNVLGAMLPEWLNLPDDVVRRVLANKRCTGRFILYIVKIDAQRQATVCAYKKNRSNYALSVMFTDDQGNSEWLTSSANPTYRIVQNHSITIPQLSFPSSTLAANLLQEIQNYV